MSRTLAAVDIGTNSFHLIVVEHLDNGSLQHLNNQRVFLRLASGKKNNKPFITEDDFKKAIFALGNFTNIITKYRAKVRAVATSAVREAANNDEFVKRVQLETGINVEIIDGKTEANLIFMGMKNAIPIKDKSVIGIDIGGGSTEFIYAVDEKIQFAESVNIGAVRLSKMFFPDYLITGKVVEECENYVYDQINNTIKNDKNLKLDFAIGSSGTIDTICLIKQYALKGSATNRLNGYEFSLNEFEKIYHEIMDLKTSDERMKIPGIEAKRADVIPAGLIILRQAFKIFNFKNMVLSEFALREGIIYDMIEKV